MGALPIEIPSSLKPEYLQVLSETATLLLADADPEQVCQSVFDRLSDALGLDAYFHFLVSEDGSELRLQSCRGVPQEEIPNLERLAFGQAVCGTVAARREPMYVNHVQWRNDDMTDLIRSYGIECYVCFPLMSGDQLLGTFSFGTKRRDAYTPEEIELIHLVCKQITIAVLRRRSQEQLRRMEKLAVAGRLSATVAHEINNPLAAVNNLLFLLRAEPLSASGKEYLRMAEEQLERVGKISRQILQFYRENTPASSVRVSEVVYDALRILTPCLRERRVMVETSLPDQCTVYAVRGEVLQVLSNLLSNAVDVSREGDTLHMTARRSGKHARLSVLDHGPGIPREIAANIFEPFFTTKKGNGTGLGLWVAKQLVERNNGTITVQTQTEAPSGTTFTVSLPLAAAEVASTKAH